MVSIKKRRKRKRERSRKSGYGGLTKGISGGGFGGGGGGGSSLRDPEPGETKGGGLSVASQILNGAKKVASAVLNQSPGIDGAREATQDFTKVRSAGVSVAHGAYDFIKEYGPKAAFGLYDAAKKTRGYFKSQERGVGQKYANEEEKKAIEEATAEGEADDIPALLDTEGDDEAYETYRREEATKRGLEIIQ
jgi:hypothetical protein